MNACRFVLGWVLGGESLDSIARCVDLKIA